MAGQHHRDVQIGEGRSEFLGGGEIALGQAQNGFESADVRGHECSLDEAGARRRVCERRDDE